MPPSEAGFLAAVKGSALMRSESAPPLVDLDGLDVWPITQCAYVVIDRTPVSGAKASPLMKFIYWSMRHGDSLVAGTGYVALPPATQARVIQRLQEVQPKDGVASKMLF